MAKLSICGCGCSNLINAIDRYIAKADKDLEDTLLEEGYQEAKDIVLDANDIEDTLSDALEVELALILYEVSRLYEEGDIDSIIETVVDKDTLSQTISEAINEKLTQSVKSIVDAEIKSYDSQLNLEKLSSGTNDWIDSWSEELADIMKLSSHESMNKILNEALDNGESIEKVTEKLMDAYSFSRSRARATAITEMLTAHSAAANEAILQSPAVGRKEWRHTGSHKIEPRKHHQALDGLIVNKNENYKIVAPSGTYMAAFPRDTVLPASERVNCHCLSRGIVNDSILGLTLEERKELQREAVDKMDSDWEDELNEKNKAKSGINEDTITLDWMKDKSKAGQVSYVGGKKKWALVESGVVTNDVGLENIRSKTLKELQDDGILTVKSSTVNHSVKGEYKSASKNYQNGRLDKGGHNQECIKLLESKKIDYTVVKTFENGVRVGYVTNHTSRFKNGIVTTKTPNADIGQSWFPESWQEDDVLVAGTYVANSSVPIVNSAKFDTYNGVRVGIYVDEDGNPTTIFPDNMKQPLENDWEVAR